MSKFKKLSILVTFLCCLTLSFTVSARIQRFELIVHTTEACKNNATTRMQVPNYAINGFCSCVARNTVNSLSDSDIEYYARKGRFNYYDNVALLQMEEQVRQYCYNTGSR